MKKLNFNWKRKTGMYQNGESLYLGRIIVGTYDWNSLRPKTEPKDKTKDYQGHSILPQRDKRVYGSTIEEVRKNVEYQVTIWFNEALGENIQCGKT